MQNSESDCSFSDPVWAILSSVPSMLAYWDNHLECRFANQAYQEWFGVKGSSLFGTSLKDLLGPALFALNEPYIVAALAGKPQRFERLIPGPNGVLRPGRASYLPHVVDGKVAGFVVEVIDISDVVALREDLRRQVDECRHSHALLRRSELALRDAQRLSETGSWHWEIQADITTWSDQLYTLFGLNPSLLPPSYAQHSRLYPAPSWERLQQAVLDALTSGTPYILELEYCHSSGRQGWLEARGSVERDEAGEIVGLVGTARDISDRRFGQEAMRHARTMERLEAELAAEKRRTHQLEAQLAQLHRL